MWGHAWERDHRLSGTSLEPRGRDTTRHANLARSRASRLSRTPGSTGRPKRRASPTARPTSAAWRPTSSRSARRRTGTSLSAIGLLRRALRHRQRRCWRQKSASVDGRLPVTSATRSCGRTHPGGSTSPWPPSWPTTEPPPWPAPAGSASTSSAAPVRPVTRSAGPLSRCGRSWSSRPAAADHRPARLGVAGTLGVPKSMLGLLDGATTRTSVRPARASRRPARQGPRRCAHARQGDAFRVGAEDRPRHASPCALPFSSYRGRLGRSERGHRSAAR